MSQVPPPYAGPWRTGADSSSPPSRRAAGGGPWAPNPYAPPTECASAAPRQPVAIERLPLARPSQRLLAKLIDRALLGLALAPGIVVQLVWDTVLGVGLWLLALLAVGVSQWAMTTAHGQTLGKRWTGLRVITEKGERVGFFRGVFLRIWVMWFGSLAAGGAALLLDPWFVFGKHCKALHDHLAGTLVIVADTPGDPYA